MPDGNENYLTEVSLPEQSNVGPKLQNEAANSSRLPSTYEANDLIDPNAILPNLSIDGVFNKTGHAFTGKTNFPDTDKPIISEGDKPLSSQEGENHTSNLVEEGRDLLRDGTLWESAHDAGRKEYREYLSDIQLKGDLKDAQLTINETDSANRNTPIDLNPKADEQSIISEKDLPGSFHPNLLEGFPNLIITTPEDSAIADEDQTLVSAVDGPPNTIALDSAPPATATSRIVPQESIPNPQQTTPAALADQPVMAASSPARTTAADSPSPLVSTGLNPRLIAGMRGC